MVADDAVVGSPDVSDNANRSVALSAVDVNALGKHDDRVVRAVTLAPVLERMMNADFFEEVIPGMFAASYDGQTSGLRLIPAA